MTLDKIFEILLAELMLSLKAKTVLVSSVLSIFLLTAPTLAQAAKPSPLPARRGLTQASLRSCQAKEEAVKTRMTSLTNLAKNIEDKFDAIAKRVEDFYILTVIPSGKSVPNYDALVADISAKKAVVQTDLTSAQGKVTAFSCTDNDPRGLLTQFRVDMQKVKSDLKLYRTSIKNLIVAVRPLASKATEKPEATKTP